MLVWEACIMWDKPSDFQLGWLVLTCVIQLSYLKPELSRSYYDTWKVKFHLHHNFQVSEIILNTNTPLQLINSRNPHAFFLCVGGIYLWSHWMIFLALLAPLIDSFIIYTAWNLFHFICGVSWFHSSRYFQSCLEILYWYCGFALDEKLNIFFVIKKIVTFSTKKKTSGRLEKNISFLECTRMRNQKHRARKTSGSCLINLQRVPEIILSAYILFPSLRTLFTVWWCTNKKGVLFQGFLSLSEKHSQFMQLVPLSLFIRKRFYFFPSQGNNSLGIEQWVPHLVPFHLVLFFFNLCLKVRGTFLGVELSGIFCVLKYLLYPLENTSIPSLLIFNSLLFQWLGIIKNRNQTIDLFSLEANVICNFSNSCPCRFY